MTAMAYKVDDPITKVPYTSAEVRTEDGGYVGRVVRVVILPSDTWRPDEGLQKEIGMHIWDSLDEARGFLEEHAE